MSEKSNPDEVEWLRSPTMRTEKSTTSPSVSATNKEPSWLSVSPKRVDESFPSPDGSVQAKRKSFRPVKLTEETTCCGCCPADPVMYWFRLFHIIAGLTGLTSMVINLYILTNPSLGFVDIVVHLFNIVLCFVIIVVEMDWRFILVRFTIMDWWICRGLFYAFVGFITLINEDLALITLQSTPVTVSGFVQIFFGLMYILMGISCVKSIEERRSLASASPQYVEIPDVATNRRQSV